MIKEFVITTEIVGKKVYVVYASQPVENGKVVVTYNPHLSDALEFHSKKAASDFIDTINNPFERIFNIENN